MLRSSAPLGAGLFRQARSQMVAAN